MEGNKDATYPHFTLPYSCLLIRPCVLAFPGQSTLADTVYVEFSLLPNFLICHFFWSMFLCFVPISSSPTPVLSFIFFYLFPSWIYQFLDILLFVIMFLVHECLSNSLLSYHLVSSGMLIISLLFSQYLRTSNSLSVPLIHSLTQLFEGENSVSFSHCQHTPLKLHPAFIRTGYNILLQLHITILENAQSESR